MPSTGASLRSGDELGSYQLLVPIGAGGMGRVWVARERRATGTPRLVAIKTALAEEGASESFYKVLLDEARISSMLEHPNVCVIYGAERARGVVYLVMDFLGRRLAQGAARRAAGSPPAARGRGPRSRARVRGAARRPRAHG